MNFNTVHDWILKTVKDGPQPFLLGLNGPQGSGKSTLATQLCGSLAKAGIRALSVSIDDFYLSRNRQVSLAQSFSDNPFLQQRGYPGTHDVELGLATLLALKQMNSKSSSTVIPRYDKSAFNGKGDRLPESQWPHFAGILDLVILEGWMLGFSPVQESQLPNGDFKVVNEFLRRYHVWHDMLDGFIQLKPDDYRHVLQWRVEAEERMKAEGKSGMSLDEVRRYTELFIPAYATYLPRLEEHPPVNKNLLVVPIGRGRLPLN